MARSLEFAHVKGTKHAPSREDKFIGSSDGGLLHGNQPDKRVYQQHDFDGLWFTDTSTDTTIPRTTSGSSASKASCPLILANQSLVITVQAESNHKEHQRGVEYYCPFNLNGAECLDPGCKKDHLCSVSFSKVQKKAPPF